MHVYFCPFPWAHQDGELNIFQDHFESSFDGLNVSWFGRYFLT